MIVNIRLDLTDDELRRVASLSAGKAVKRKAKRKEVIALVEKLLADVLGVTETAPRSTAQGKPDEARLVSKLRMAGYDDSYIRGALQVYRSQRP